MTDRELREIYPTDAVEQYLAEKRQGTVSERTVSTYSDHLNRFTAWATEQNIDHLLDVDGLTFRRYKTDLAGDYAPATVQNHLGSLQRLLNWGASIDAVPGHVTDKIEVSRDQYTRSGSVPTAATEAILDRLSTFRYASMDHVTFALMWSTGARVGTIRGFDVTDLGETDGGPFIQAKHRPESGTPLKNGEGGERPISLAEETAEMIADYCEHNRPDVTDGHGREPLLATPQGRAALSTLRTVLYAVTRPCWYGDECPEGRDPSECKAAAYKRTARECPVNNTPHDVRRGRLTHYRRNEVPKELISDRADVSGDVLEAHYNVMSDEEKMEQRRGYLTGL